MGGSGAGKTTLLDVLACNSIEGGKVGGSVAVNGAKRNDKEFAKISCYVMQRDLLYPSATVSLEDASDACSSRDRALLRPQQVRECVTTSALLRLPMRMSREDKLRRVEEVLSDLDLLRCADTLVGDEVLGMKGISGGQKRRTSLAIDLVKDPAVIFADEPTSGLDSEVALNIMEALLMLARKQVGGASVVLAELASSLKEEAPCPSSRSGWTSPTPLSSPSCSQRTVVCTIHQPNSDITAMFDDFMLLSHGRCVYHGPWAAAVDWFAAQGFKTPSFKNPSDYFMSIIKDGVTSARLADAYRDQTSAAKEQLQIITVEDPTATAREGDNHYRPHTVIDLRCSTDGTAVSSLDTAEPSSSSSDAEKRAPTWMQVHVLTKRTLLNWLRNPVMLAAELMQYVFVSVFIGLMYWGSFTLDSDGVSNRASCIWFAFAVMSFVPSYTAATSWHSERHLVKKELQQRQYGVTSWYLARTLVTLPFQCLQCLLFVSIM